MSQLDEPQLQGTRYPIDIGEIRASNVFFLNRSYQCHKRKAFYCFTNIPHLLVEIWCPNVPYRTRPDPDPVPLLSLVYTLRLRQFEQRQEQRKVRFVYCQSTLCILKEMPGLDVLSIIQVHPMFFIVIKYYRVC